MDEFVIMIKTLLALAGGVSIIGSAAIVIIRVIKPAIGLSKRITSLERHEKENLGVLEENVITNNLLCRAVIALIDNRITGNSFEGLNSIKKEMLEHLTRS